MNEPSKLCVFCGKDESFGVMNREHFVPRGLWDKKRPQFTLTVPAHKECNERYSDDNEYFRDALAISQQAIGHPEVLKLNTGAIRRKLKKRRGAFLKNFGNMSLRPQFTLTGLYVGHAPMFDWDWPRIETVLKNIMRGIFYRMMEHPMPQEMAMTVGEVRDGFDYLQVKPVVDKMCPWNGFGDDVFSCRCVFHSQDKYMFCLMRFYGSVTFFGKGVLPEHGNGSASGR